MRIINATAILILCFAMLIFAVDRTEVDYYNIGSCNGSTSGSLSGRVLSIKQGRVGAWSASSVPTDNTTQVAISVGSDKIAYLWIKDDANSSKLLALFLSCKQNSESLSFYYEKSGGYPVIRYAHINYDKSIAQ